MDLTLSRSEYRSDGVFGQLRGLDFAAVTLEHAFTDGAGGYYPKVPPGRYVCKKGIHRLENALSSFETFEVENVPGHTGILFHVGNYNEDSNGCILLGNFTGPASTKKKMIVNSKLAFQRFMALQAGAESFNLEILA